MDEFQDLLSRLGSDNPPTVDELTEAREAMRAVLLEATTPATLNLELAREMRGHVDRVNAELSRLETEAAEAAEEAAQLREGLEDDEGANLENVDEDANAGNNNGETENEDENTTNVNVPVAAGNVSEAALRALGAIKRRAARDGESVPTPPAVRVSVAGPALGARTPESLRDVANIFHNHAHRTSRGKQPLVSLSYEYPSNRRLANGATENTRLLEDILSGRALTASGGICEPLPADFSHPICGDRGRPIRAALPRFAAGQGGVRFAPSATLADLAGLGSSGPVTVWTHDDDVAGTGAKACPHVECEPEVEIFVDAVVACLEVGNFQARFNPEFWRSQLDLLMVLHDRIAEQTLFNTMVSLSTAVTFTDLQNTAQTMFVNLDRAIGAFRSRHRLLTTALRWIGPAWLRDAVRASIAQQNATADPAAALSVADATINSFFTDRNVTPTWSPDVDPFGAQTAGALIPWPGSNAQGLLFPEGTFFFLDGGTLDLGTEIRDSTLNTTNDRQAFLETFENVAFRGCESYVVTLPVDENCVCGAEAAT